MLSTFRPAEVSLPVVTGTELTFSEFMAARWAPLYRTAYLLTGDAHEAEELLQAALARTCVRWGSIREKGAADAYVRRAMVHQMASRWRRPHREFATDELPDRGHGGGLDVRADHLALWDEIRRLPPRMRATLVLRYVEDLTEAATARELGVSIGSVKSQTHNALKRLRAALPDLELTP
jgi:RNA polymerase sigma-70 factor (sigma-E family)